LLGSLPAVLGSLPSEAVEAQAPGPTDPEAGGVTEQPKQGNGADPVQVAVTIGGGVSLGSYQAGFLYLTRESFKRSRGQRNLPLLTGASAGSINALLSAFDLCKEPNPHPRRDLGYRSWVDLGFEDLFVPEQAGVIHVFSRDALDRAFARFRSRWMAGLPEPCDVVVGMTATRIEGYPVRLHDALDLSRLTEKFAIRIQGRGPGQAPRVTNYHDPSAEPPQALLELEPDANDPEAQRANFQRLRDLVYASSAFPLAFAPRRLGFCMTGDDGATEDRLCPRATRHEWFLDGGVLDNNPVRLSHQLAEQGLRRGAKGARWRDIHKTEALGRGLLSPRYDEVRFAYVDPDTTAYPQPAPEPRSDAFDIVALVKQLGGELIATARSRELYALAEEEPELVRQLFLTQRRFPTMSEPLAAFFGFFERELRRFDFYLGMYDAYAESARAFERYRVEATLEATLATLMPAFEGGAVDQIPDDWRPFACMVGWYDSGAKHLRQACEGEGLRDFRILLQTSLDRLYATCSGLSRDRWPSKEEHGHCRRAAKGLPAPRVVPAPPHDPRTDRQAENESDFDHMMRLLGTYGFHYADLGLERDEAELGRVKIRRKLLGLIEALANAQPDRRTRSLLLTGGRLAVNRIEYEPPRHWGYATIGSSIGAGASVLPFEWNRSWARLNVDLAVGELETLVSAEDAALTFTLTAGPELELLWWSTDFVQPLLGIRAGYQLGSGDRFEARPCTAGRSQLDARNCSQPVVHGYAAVAIVERFRVQLVLEYFPRARALGRSEGTGAPFGERRFDLEVGFGMQFF
jgi:hypothetical protein